MIGEKVAAIFKEERLKRGMNYEEFGRLLGVSGRCISYWESGERFPKDIEVIHDALIKLNRSVKIGKRKLF